MVRMWAGDRGVSPRDMDLVGMEEGVLELVHRGVRGVWGVLVVRGMRVWVLEADLQVQVRVCPVVAGRLICRPGWDMTLPEVMTLIDDLGGGLGGHVGDDL